jgi:hypothetical protein
MAARAASRRFSMRRWRARCSNLANPSIDTRGREGCEAGASG